MSSTMEEPKSVAEMIGEMLREAAVLVAVFVPLDVVLAFNFTMGWKDVLLLIESTVLASALFAVSGVVIERKRTR